MSIKEDNIFTIDKDKISFVFSYFFDFNSYEEFYILDVKDKNKNIQKSINFDNYNQSNKFWIQNFIEKIIEDNKFKNYFFSLKDSLQKKDVGKILTLNPNLEKEIKKINKKSSFKDYTKLKSGFDDYSKLKKEDLELFLNEVDLFNLRKEFKDEKSYLSCLRWICRGLDMDYAIHKIKVDIEIHENAINSKKKK